MKRALIALTITVAGLAATATSLLATSAAAPRAHRAATSDPSPDPVIQWNRTLLALQGTPGNQPPTVHPTYDLAIMHAAIYDAVVAIDHSGRPYLVNTHGARQASLPAAVDAAAHDTLVALYPGLQATIDQDYADLLAQVPDGVRKLQGVHVGRVVARQLLKARAGDGSDATLIPFTPGDQPGDYQLTPPSFSQPVFTHWPFVRPFGLRSADQFRPAPPPALSSTAYADAINEVKSVGVASGSTRTPDQTQIGQFWSPGIWIFWNQIAQAAALGHGSSLSEDARTFALLNLTVADSIIASYEAKYTYALWRPITAIRAADTDGNPATTADPSWTPLVNTPPDPSYPGAHSLVSSAAAPVLESVYGDHFQFSVTSSTLPGVQRSFSSFSDAALEAGLSRIYAGVHSRLDHVSGQELGTGVAGWDIAHLFAGR